MVEESPPAGQGDTALLMGGTQNLGCEQTAPQRRREGGILQLEEQLPRVPKSRERIFLDPKVI